MRMIVFLLLLALPSQLLAQGGLAVDLERGSVCIGNCGAQPSEDSYGVSRDAEESIFGLPIKTPVPVQDLADDEDEDEYANSFHTEESFDWKGRKEPWPSHEP